MKKLFSGLILLSSALFGFENENAFSQMPTSEDLPKQTMTEKKFERKAFGYAAMTGVWLKSPVIGVPAVGVSNRWHRIDGHSAFALDIDGMSSISSNILTPSAKYLFYFKKTDNSPYLSVGLGSTFNLMTYHGTDFEALPHIPVALGIQQGRIFAEAGASYYPVNTSGWSRDFSFKTAKDDIFPTARFGFQF